MFKIGDFSTLTQVSIKTLHYYDEIGLLKPTRIDGATGYRYYSSSQLPRLNRILAFKDLGFSLEQIAQLLDDNLPATQLRGMLKLKQAEVEQVLQAEHDKLKRIEARLHQIEREDKILDYSITIKAVKAVKVVSIRRLLPNYSSLNQLFDELADYAALHKITPTNWIVTWHDNQFKEQDIDTEVALTADQTLPEDATVKIMEIPTLPTVASTLHLGTIDSLVEAYSAIMTWVEANGYRISGSGRTIFKQYKKGQGQSLYRSEVQIPIEIQNE